MNTRPISWPRWPVEYRLNVVETEPTVAAALASARAQAPDLARLDIDLLLAQALDRGRAFVRAWPEHRLSDRQWALFHDLLSRRVRGEPLAYLLGRREFWSLSLAVSPHTLIPRPETELLVETALARLPADGVSVLDLGTGSGAIALALASERPGWRVEGVDIDPACVAVARRNARELGLANVSFRAADWFDGAGRFRLIVANPPYIDPAYPGLERGDLRFEPRSALVAAEGGMADIRHIAERAPAHLAAGGWLMVEHGYDQARRCRQLFERLGYLEIENKRDLAGLPRVALGRTGGLPNGTQ